MTPIFRIAHAIRAWCEQTSGIASFEVALWLAALVPAVFTTVDLGTYLFQRMQVENASQMAVQAAWATCEETSTADCPNLTTAVANAIASTSLGSSVTQPSALTEGWYCPDTSTNELVAHDASACDSGASPGYYVTLTVSYPYSPVIGAISMASFLPTPITKTAWIRLQ
jgi:Flp pilus assembly protein TadG